MSSLPVMSITEATAISSLKGTIIYMEESLRSRHDYAAICVHLEARGARFLHHHYDFLHTDANLVVIKGEVPATPLDVLRGFTLPLTKLTVQLDRIVDWLDILDAQTVLLADVGRAQPNASPVADEPMLVMASGSDGVLGGAIRERMKTASIWVRGKKWLQGKVAALFKFPPEALRYTDDRTELHGVERSFVRPPVPIGGRLRSPRVAKYTNRTPGTSARLQHAIARRAAPKGMHTLRDLVDSLYPVSPAAARRTRRVRKAVAMPIPTPAPARIAVPPPAPASAPFAMPFPAFAPAPAAITALAPALAPAPIAITFPALAPAPTAIAAPAPAPVFTASLPPVSRPAGRTVLVGADDNGDALAALLEGTSFSSSAAPGSAAGPSVARPLAPMAGPSVARPIAGSSARAPLTASAARRREGQPSSNQRRMRHAMDEADKAVNAVKYGGKGQ